jgi:hypothetical protein
MEAVMTYFKAIAEHFLGIQENHKWGQLGQSIKDSNLGLPEHKTILIAQPWSSLPHDSVAIDITTFPGV